MNLHKTVLSIVVAVCVGGCASTDAQRIDPGVQGIVRVGDVDIRDINEARTVALESLLSTGALAKAPKSPPIIRIGTFTNNTSTKIPMAMVLDGIEEQLTNSGQAIVNTSAGANPEARIAQEKLRRKQLETGESVEIADDFELTGRIEQAKSSAGDVRQTTYQFSFALTALSGDMAGQQVWKKAHPISKAGKKSAVSF
jgi:hypothetical protein